MNAKGFLLFPLFDQFCDYANICKYMRACALNATAAHMT